MYICIKAIKEGFLYGCRRLIGVDGCFLKGLMGQLFVAVGRDGNNQMLPISWAVVEKETSDSWKWFLQQLQEDLCIGEGLGWALISDMQKGLINAVNTLFPLIEHRMCARHIYARFGKQFPGKEMQIQFWNTSRATYQPEMQKQLQIMRNVKGGTKAVEVLLERWPISSWCLACFNDVVQCDVIDNNMCETFNGVLVETRAKPIISMLEDIRKYVMNRIVVKREYALKWDFDLGPNIVAKLEKERNKCAKWHIEWNGATSHEVSCDDILSQVKESYVVGLPNRSCSCGKWDKSGLPNTCSFMFNGQALRNRRFASRRTKNEETNHQACRTIEAPNISTTQQEALEILATQQSMTTTESKETPQMSSVKATQESMITEHVIS
ncbi:uncharacterized protein LOC120276335 [Dioscorea cayenensis subsp. rotundata]|uniref:Uncharacterized protein LOC120276335 n=1 Tax=Dioscorea cayennensis subsp. rotundata TaxID=55577 RepID=A0AB40CHF0_DIOCR|nr:uncharacterized protein LOC120276335 [Dioscorea cayenensis subsp. rotundata]